MTYPEMTGGLLWGDNLAGPGRWVHGAGRRNVRCPVSGIGQKEQG